MFRAADLIAGEFYRRRAFDAIRSEQAESMASTCAKLVTVPSRHISKVRHATDVEDQTSTVRAGVGAAGRLPGCTVVRTFIAPAGYPSLGRKHAVSSRRDGAWLHYHVTVRRGTLTTFSISSPEYGTCRRVDVGADLHLGPPHSWASRRCRVPRPSYRFRRSILSGVPSIS